MLYDDFCALEHCPMSWVAVMWVRIYRGFHPNTHMTQLTVIKNPLPLQDTNMVMVVSDQAGS